MVDDKECEKKNILNTKIMIYLLSRAKSKVNRDL